LRQAPFRLIITLLTICVIAIAHTGCKENTIIDSKVAPNLNNISVVELPDTLTVLCKTVFDDSVITSLNVTGIPIYQALGYITNDPIFGKTNAGIYMQVIPVNTNPLIFMNGEVIDSVMLFLPYAGVTFGDTSPTAPTEKISVYRIDSTISASGNYYPSSSFGPDFNTVYGSTTVNLNNLVTDSPFIYGAKRMPALVIKMNNIFQNTLANASNTSGTDFPTFLNAFRGFYIAASDTTTPASSLPYFQLDGADTFTQAGVLVFHHTPGSDTEQVFQYPYNMTYCGHSNHISRNYTGTVVSNYMNNASAPTDRIFLQNQPGAAIDLKVPAIAHLKDSLPVGAVINKAELIITQSTNPLEISSTFTTPVKLFPLGVATSAAGVDTGIYFIEDRYPATTTSALAFLDGYRQIKTVSGISTSQYTINIPREVISCMNQRKALHLHINGTQDYPGGFRLVTGGITSPDPNYKIRLKITYTKLKQ
jgi:hypothetical protein